MKWPISGNLLRARYHNEFTIRATKEYTRYWYRQSGEVLSEREALDSTSWDMFIAEVIQEEEKEFYKTAKRVL